MVVKCKIFCDTPDKVERQVNEWIKNTKMTPLRFEAEKSGFQVLHTHVFPMPPNKVCFVFFYEVLKGETR